MKRILSAILALILVFGLVGCDAITTTQVGTQSTRPTYVMDTIPEEIPEEVPENRGNHEFLPSLSGVRRFRRFYRGSQYSGLRKHR